MRIAIVLFCLYSIYSGQAQTRTDRAQIEWGEEFRVTKRTTQKGLVLTDHTGIYNLVLEGMGSKPVIQKFDDNLHLVQSTQLALNAKDMVLSFKFIESLASNIYAFSTYSKPKSDTSYLYYSKLNKDTLDRIEEATLLIEIDGGDGNVDFNAGNFQHVVSEDTTKLLIYHRESSNYGEKERFLLKVFDENMKLVLEENVELPYDEAHFAQQMVKLGNDGTVYIAGKVFQQTRAETADGNSNQHFAVVAFYPEFTSGKVYDITLEDKYISDIQLSIQDNRDIVCAGFYSEEGTNSLRGTYYMKIAFEAGAKVEQSVQDFSLEFLNFGMKERNPKKKNKKIVRGENANSYQLEIHDIVRKEDGGMLLIGEQSWINMVTTASGTGNGSGSTITTYLYNYLDIYVVSINREGYIEWFQKIPKKQVTSNDGGMYSSYGFKVSDDHLYFIFNDHPENLFYTSGLPATFTANKRRFVPMLISIDRNGNTEREALMNESDGNYYLRPKTMKSTSRDEVISYVHGKRSQQLARIKFLP